MLIGIVGAPNKGKSTMFSALTLNDVAIADYPFTTIDPNLGVAYATKECAHVKLGIKCKPRNSLCTDGVRKIPVNIVDVAGLVEGAHIGKGMGNKFLNDLAAADSLIIVADASGQTDAAGNRSTSSDPTVDVSMVQSELSEWLASIIKKHMKALSRKQNGIEALASVLTGMKIGKAAISDTIAETRLPASKIDWDEDATYRFAEALIFRAKPYLIAANKMDSKLSEQNAAKLEQEFGNDKVIRVSAAIELALEKAEKTGVIKSSPDGRFTIVGTGLSAEQTRALEYMRSFVDKNGRNLRTLVNVISFKLLDNIVVYPVEDEHKYTDSMGNVLPDAIMVKRGSTPHDLARVIHTDLADHMLYAIDARKKTRMAKDHILEDGDIVKIVSTAKHA